MSTLPMNWGSDDLSGFLEIAQQNTYATFANMKNEFSQLRMVDDAFRKLVSVIEIKDGSLPPFFLLRAHSAYLGGVRLAVSAQVTEAYMVLRGSLESALYGYHFHTQPTSEPIWLARDDDESSKKAARKELGNLQNVMKGLKVADSTAGEAASILYERTLDLGGHPNPMSFFSNLAQTGADKNREIELAYLNSDPNVLATCLRSCVQIGLVNLLIFRQIFVSLFDTHVLTDELKNLSKTL